MQPEEVKKMIAEHLLDAQIEVRSEDDVHFEATVISSQFAGKTRVQQQQAVYAALNDAMTSGRLHALSLKTYTPDEWQTQLMNKSNG
jgi:acid stress-induced BolA-like protein IbaG/YrbA